MFKGIKKQVIIKSIFEWGAIAGCTGILFYDSVWACMLFFLFFPLFFQKKKKVYKEKEEQEMAAAFQDVLQSFSAALEAGYSVENSLYEIRKDLRMIHPSDAGIMKELNLMIRQMENNIPMEVIFTQFSERTKSEDIESFVRVFTTAKRTGGNLIKIIKNNSSIISEKGEVLKEIQTVIAAKRYETKIMKIVPYGILAYFKFCSSEFLSVLYKNLGGIFLMSILLLFYLAANKLADRITAIEV